MPELPEVETVRRTLSDVLIGKKIERVDVRYENIIKNISAKDFSSSLIGETFIDIKRKGKHLIFVLDNYYMIAHLRMEGKYFLMHDEELSKHDHIIFYFSDSNLRYNDVRKFGTIHLFSKKTYPNISDLERLEPLSSVGIEPFEMDKKDLYKYTCKSHKHIKTLLLDQSIMCGLGNIYVQ